MQLWPNGRGQSGNPASPFYKNLFESWPMMSIFQFTLSAKIEEVTNITCPLPIGK